jgi:hypothetical protein
LYIFLLSDYIYLGFRDTRLGGYYKPIVGVGVADLSTKLPWTPNYIAHQSDEFIPSAVVVDTEAHKKTSPDNKLIPGGCLVSFELLV